MSRIEIKWPFSGAPSEVETYTGSGKYYFADQGDLYRNSGTIAAAVTGLPSGTVYGGSKSGDVSEDIYIAVKLTDGAYADLTVYGGGLKGDSENVSIYLASGDIRSVYGSAGSSGPVENVAIWVDAGASADKEIKIGKSSSSVAKSGTVTLHGENVLSGFTGLLSGLFKSSETKKKAYGKLVFDEADTEFTGKMDSFSDVTLTKSKVTLSNMEKSSNYKNIGTITVDADSVLTLEGAKNYNVNSAFNGTGKIVFSGIGNATVKVGGGTFSGTAEVASNHSLTLKASAFSTTVDKASLILNEGSSVILNGKGVILAAALKGGSASSVLSTCAGGTVSGSVTDFDGIFAVSGSKSSLTIASSLTGGTGSEPLDLCFNGGTIFMSSNPSEMVSLNIMGKNGVLNTSGHKFTVSSNLSQNLTVFGSGTALVINLDEDSEKIKSVYAGGKSSNTVYSSYSVTINSGYIGSVFGGGQGENQTSLFGTVTSTVNLNGGTADNIYGGVQSVSGYASSGLNEVKISGGTVLKNIYGGGFASDYGVSAYSSGTEITITGGTVLGNIYGGGIVVEYEYVENTTRTQPYSITTDSVNISISGSAVIAGNIYLGGKSGSLGGTYLTGDNNTITFSNVRSEGEEDTALSLYNKTISGSYAGTDGDKKGDMIFSDYQAEFLGKLQSFKNVFVEGESALTLNWDKAASWAKNMGVFDIDEDSVLTLNMSAKKAKLDLYLAGEGTVVLSKKLDYSLTRATKAFTGTIQVADQASLTVTGKKAYNTDGEPVIALGDESDFYFGVSGTSEFIFKGGTTSALNFTKNNLKVVCEGGFSEFYGDINLAGKKTLLSVDTADWTDLRFNITGASSIVYISDGAGTVYTDGICGEYAAGGCNVTFTNEGSQNAVIYAGAVNENVLSVNIKINSGEDGTGEYDSVYAGCASADVIGDALIQFSGGAVSGLYAGGYGKNADITGTSTLILDAGTIGNVYGGAYISGKGTATVAKNIIQVNNVTVTGNIYAGGYAEKSGKTTVGESEIIFGKDFSFSGTVSDSGVAADKKSFENVSVSTVAFQDFSGAFAGTVKGFNKLSLRGNTELAFLNDQARTITAKTIGFDLANRNSGLDAMLTVSAADQAVVKAFTKADMSIERSSLAVESAGTVNVCKLISGINEFTKSISISGLSDKSQTLSVGDTITLNDEVYTLTLKDNVLALEYTIGSNDQILVKWDDGFYDRYAPLSVYQFAHGTPVNAETCGYRDLDGNTSLKLGVKEESQGEITVDTSAVSGNVWLNLGGSGTNVLIPAVESGTVKTQNLNIDVYGTWETISSEAEINKNAWIDMEAGAYVKDLSVSNVAGMAHILMDGGTADTITGGTNSTVLFRKNYEELKSVISAGTISVSGGTVSLVTGSLDAQNIARINSDAVLNLNAGTASVEFMAGNLTGSGTLAQSSGKSLIEITNDFFTGDVKVNGGTMTFSNNKLLASDSVKISTAEGAEVIFTLSDDYTAQKLVGGSGTLGFLNSMKPEEEEYKIRTVSFADDKYSSYQGSLRFYSGVNAVYSGTYGAALNLGGDIDSVFNLTGAAAQSVEKTTISNDGMTVCLNAKTITVSSNTGRIVYGGCGELYTTKTHTVSLSETLIPTTSSKAFFCGAGEGSNMGSDDNKIESWSKISGGTFSIKATSAATFTGTLEQLYLGSLNGTVKGDVYMKLAAGTVSNLYGAGLGGTVGGNVWIDLAEGSTVGNIYAGGAGDSKVGGNAEIHIDGQVGLNGEIISLSSITGTGKIVLQADTEDTGIAGFGGTIIGGYVEKTETETGTGNRTISFNSYKNSFAGSIKDVNIIELVGGTVSMKGTGAQTLASDKLTIDESSLLILENTELVFSGRMDGAVIAVSGKGGILANLNASINAELSEFTGKITAAADALLGINGILGSSLNLNGEGSFAIGTVTAAEDGTAIKGNLTGSNAALYLGESDGITLADGTYASVYAGSAEQTEADLKMSLNISNEFAAGGTIHSGATSGNSVIAVTGTGSLTAAMISGSLTSGNAVFAFNSYKGTVAASVEKIGTWSFTGASQVIMTKAFEAPNAIAFDLTEREAASASSAILSVSDDAVMAFTGTSISIKINLEEIESSGSFLMLGSEQAMTSVLPESFLLEDAASGETLSLAVGVESEWKDKKFQLALSDSDTKLTFGWSSVEPSLLQDSSPLTQGWLA